MWVQMLRVLNIEEGKEIFLVFEQAVDSIGVGFLPFKAEPFNCCHGFPYT